MGAVDLEAAVIALGSRGVSVGTDLDAIPRLPGLYALHGGGSVWAELGLGDPPDGRPLYVGKAEDDFVSRDVRQHFGTGRTGSSTVRRSLGALLVDRLALTAVPRNPEKPGYFANFAFEAEGEERLTEWMLARLRLATWPHPDVAGLGALETEVLGRLVPPLNLNKVVTPWMAQVKAARGRMAAAAKAAAAP